MRTIEVRNAKITSTSINIEDHGFLTAWLYLDYGGSGQGFGGHALATKAWKSEAASIFLMRTLEVLGETKWEKLPGVCCRVRYEYSKVHSIGHILEDRWFTPSEEFAHLQQEPRA